MAAIVIANLPQLALGLCWTAVVFAAGRKFERWRRGGRSAPIPPSSKRST